MLLCLNLYASFKHPITGTIMKYLPLTAL